MRKELSHEAVEILAVVTDSLMSNAAEERGLFDNYVHSLIRIGEYVDEGLYEVAIEMILQNAILLNKEAYKLIDELIYSDYEATNIFLEYYHEYIEDGYVLESILEEAFDDEEGETFEIDFGDFTDDEEDEKTNILDEAFTLLKRLLRTGVDEDGRSKSSCDM